MASFPDHFSAGADRYAEYRPTYPSALYEWLAKQVPAGARAWDCGAGNGQAAIALRAHVREVIATDASEAQLRQAPRVPGVHYAVAAAEASGLADASVGLVTVAQAAHWFDLPRFYQEVRRVSVPGGLLAMWSYGSFSIDPEIDAIVGRFKAEVSPYWPPERALVDAGYANLDFPFEEIVAPPFAMEAEWTLAQLQGYLETWSAVSRYYTERRINPTTALIEALRPNFGDHDARAVIRWPLAFKIGTVSK